MRAAVRALAAIAMFFVSIPFVLLAGVLMSDDGRKALGLALAEVVRIMHEGRAAAAPPEGKPDDHRK